MRNIANLLLGGGTGVSTVQPGGDARRSTPILVYDDSVYDDQ
jgi:hypothetical protein